MNIIIHKLGLDWLIIANILLTSIYSPFISDLSLIHILSAGFSVVVVSLAIVDTLLYKKIKWYHLLLFFCMVYFIVLTLAYAAMGNGVNALVRAYLPFFYLPSFALVILCLNENHAQKLLKALLFLGVVESFSIIPFFIELKLGRIPYCRFTAYSDLSHTPIFLMALPLCYCLLKKCRYIAVAAIMLAIFFTQSKGQILLGFFALVVCEMFSLRSRVILLFKLILIVILCALPFFAYENVIAKRFANIGGETTLHRLVEIQKAVEIFQESPLIGGGPNVQFDITGLKTSVEEGGQRYIHNLIMYILATGGIIGCMFYSFPYMVIMATRKSLIQKYILVSLISTFGYLLVSATFKSIQTNMFLGILLGCYATFGGLGRNEHKIFY